VLTVLLSSAYFYYKKLQLLHYLTSVVLLLLAFNVLTTLSMNIDRSRSVAVLVFVEHAENRHLGLLKTLDFYGVAPSEYDAFVQRFEEQSQIKLLAGNLEKPKLTFIGKIFLKIADYLAEIWNLDGYRKIAQA
jgi:hypothetical protein